MTERVTNSIERLYETFEKYRSNSNMNGSPVYGDLAEWNTELFAKPLRELTEDDLSRFTGKAISTWGEAIDYKHFLPRIFELTAELRTPYEIWIAFDKLALADWKNWPENEQKVIHEFMIALWENILNDDSEKARWEFQDYFSALAQFYPNFSELLDIWAKSESKAAIKHLSTFLIEEQTSIFDKKKLSNFQDKPEIVDKFIAWAFSDQLLEHVQRTFFKFENESFAENISWAEQIITQRKKSMQAENLQDKSI